MAALSPITPSIVLELPTAVPAHAREKIERAFADLDGVPEPIALKRHIVADLVAALIDYLDDTEGDCDLEPTGDELDTSYPEGGCGGARLFGADLREDDEEDGTTCEPSLGACETCSPHVKPLGFWQVRPHWVTLEDWAADLDCPDDVTRCSSLDHELWARGGADDGEDEHDGSEPDADTEPTLGWTDSEAVTGCSSSVDCDEAEPSLGWTMTEAAYGRYGASSKEGADHEDEHNGIEPVEYL